MNEVFKVADELYRNEVIAELSSKYSFLQVKSIGESRCNRQITAISVGNPQNQVLIVGGVHGSEWITSNLILLYIERLCSAIKKRHKVTPEMNTYVWYLRRAGVIFVPCLNPDGVEIALHGPKSCSKCEQLINKVYNKGIWQANAAGVDINHNFPADWDDLHKLEIKNCINSPNNTRYGGKEPASEPETKAIMNLCYEKQFRHAIAFHSQGEEIYWGYKDNIPNGSERLAKAFSKSSGYTLSEPEGLAVGGGFKDWFILEFNRPGFTVEVGKGKNPLPISDLTDIYAKIHNMISLSIVL